jgi:hypothetical protein
MKPTHIPLICAALGLTSIACANSTWADGLTGFYLGGSFGGVRNDFDANVLDGQYQRAAAAFGDKLKLASSSVQRDSEVWSVNAGYMPWAYLGFDLSFLRLGELTHRSVGTLEESTGNEPAVISATLASHGPALALLGRLPLTDALDLDIRLGDYYGKASLTNGFTNDSKYRGSTEAVSSSSLLLGVGAAYSFAGHWSARLDYLRINGANVGGDFGKYNANLATVGVTYTF